MILETVNRVLAKHEGEIGTHYEGCWMNHVACLAAVIRDQILEEES